MKNFIWNMTEQDYNRYIGLHKNKDDSENRDSFGTASFDRFDIEFRHAFEKDTWLAFIDIYEKADNGKYKMTDIYQVSPPKTDEGRPLLIDYKSFKIFIEHDFIKALINHDVLKNEPKLVDLVLDGESGSIGILLAEHGLALDRLVKDSNPYVRKAVADYCSGDIDILSQLAVDADLNVRRSVAKHCDGNKDILDVLKNDTNIYIRAEIAKQGYNHEEYINDESALVRVMVAKSDFSDWQELVYLANDENWEVREAVAARGVATDVLVHDPDDNVRCAAIKYIALNNAYDENALADYLDDPSDKVRATLARLGYGLDKLVNDPAHGVSDVAKTVLRQQEALMSNKLEITDRIEDVLEPLPATKNFYGMTYNAMYTVNIGVCDDYNEYQVEMIGKSYNSGKNAVAYISNFSNFAVCTENPNTVFPLPAEFIAKLETYISEQVMVADKEQTHSKGQNKAVER